VNCISAPRELRDWESLKTKGVVKRPEEF